MRNLVIVFGDQLSHWSSAFTDFDPDQDAVWTKEVTRIAWIDVTKRGKVRVPKNMGWHVHRRAVRHAALGGVTDATFSCFHVSRFEEDHEWRLLGMGIQSSLRQVVDPTNGG